MTDTPNLALPYILAAQAQKHVTHNEAIRALDALVHLSVADRNLSAPPASPVDGARYLVAAAATGAWAGQSGKIAAWQDGAWAFYAPRDGWLAWIADENIALVHDNGGWSALTGSGGGVSDHGALTGLADDDHPHYLNTARGDARYTPLAPATLGINATADTTNRLAVAAAATLLNNAGAGHQLKINKNAAADTASILYQTAFSGRAELGTAGDDNFHFKVSANGSAWTEAIVIDRTTGSVSLPASDCDVQVVTAPGAFTWTKPAWANANSIVEVQLHGAGGGGGSGRRGSASSVRCGGGGGGAGGFVTFRLRASELGGSVSGAVGAGGIGAAAQTTDGTNGTSGSAGGATSFGSYRALGGNAGNGGSATSGNGGAAVGLSSPFSAQSVAGANASTSGGAGVAGATGTAVAASGAAGAGITSANAVTAGAAGGASAMPYTATTATGGSAGGAGAAGGNGATLALPFGVGNGAGGGSGGSSTTAAAGKGGNGGPGAGGGGGGASLDGFNSGGGGNGGDGWALVVTYR